ncbi:uncharacterized protein TNCV_2786701 [Trichonephila clavipes]|nr:uncharacterized protein TNCV_2786701 [Trichonephila clavipes]
MAVVLRVRVLMPQKICHVQGLTYIKSVEDQSPPFWKYPRNLESPRVISSLLQRFQDDDDNVSRRYITGHLRVTLPKEDRYLAVITKKKIPASDLPRQLSVAAGTTVPWQTVIKQYAQNEIAFVPNFHKRILFSDEAHFWLNGYVNKQNCRICSEANPQVYVETPLHPEKLTVWCALWAGGIIDPYFFKNDEGHNELWFQQDGATCPTARATIDLLKDTFGDRLIARFVPVNWPPRSCDLTPLDYFLWGYVKSLVYADKPQTLDHLEDNIRRVFADIRPQMLEKVIENRTSRLDYIRASRGSPMPEILFKM